MKRSLALLMRQILTPGLSGEIPRASCPNSSAGSCRPPHQTHPASSSGPARAWRSPDGTVSLRASREIRLSRQDYQVGSREPTSASRARPTVTMRSELQARVC